MFGLLGLEAWIFKARHVVEVLPSCYFSRFIVSLHGDLFKTSSSARAYTIAASWTTGECHVIIAVTVIGHINNADVAHLTIAFVVIWTFAIAVLAYLGPAVSIITEL